MKISDHQKLLELEGQAKQSSNNKALSKSNAKPDVIPGGEKSAATGADNVRLSAKARDVQETRKILDATPEVRREKVEALQRRIDSGTYNVKGEDIADAIIKASLLDRKV